jgi:hypothetical protein
MPGEEEADAIAVIVVIILELNATVCHVVVRLSQNVNLRWPGLD